jgi:hypothetical protein
MTDPNGSFMVGVIAMRLRTFDNAALAAPNNVIQWTGVIPATNLGYNQALEAELITEAGNPTFDLDATRDAFAHEVMNRVKDGTFN